MVDTYFGVAPRSDLLLDLALIATCVEFCQAIISDPQQSEGYKEDPSKGRSHALLVIADL